MKGKAMEKGILFRTESDKTIEGFIEALVKNGPEFNFNVRHVLNVGEDYKRHGVEVAEGFRLFQVILCNFERSYQTVHEDPVKAAILLPPKQMSVYSRDGKTVIDYLPFTQDFIAQALPEHKKFQEKLAETCRKIIRLIEKSR